MGLSYRNPDLLVPVKPGILKILPSHFLKNIRVPARLHKTLSVKNYPEIIR